MQQTEPRQHTATVALTGELDHYTAPQVRAQLDELLQDPAILHLVLDLEKLNFMDSSGIGVLLGRLRALQQRGGTLAVKNMQPAITKLFRLTGMQRVVAVVEDAKGGPSQ